MNIKGHNACVHSVPKYLANLAYTDVRATPKGFYVVSCGVLYLVVLYIDMWLEWVVVIFNVVYRHVVRMGCCIIRLPILPELHRI